jgi:hypothetical protein
MQELKQEYVKNERRLMQLKRTKKVAMYAVYPEVGDTLYGYEVIMIIIAPAREIFGRNVPIREAYPSNEQFGKLAWAYGIKQYALALARFEELSRRLDKPETP